MHEGLGRFPHIRPRVDVALLAHQAEVAPQREESFEQPPCLPLAAGEGERVDEPEAAGQEGAVLARQPLPA